MPIKPGTIYIAGAPMEIGAIPIKQELEILPADPPTNIYDHIFITSKRKLSAKKNNVIGWSMFETIGIAIVNPRGVAAGKKCTIIE